MQFTLASMALLSLSTVSIAQANFVKNGDFATTLIAPWVVTSSTTHKAMVVSFDVTGKGKTRAFASTPDTKSVLLTQKIVVVKGRRYVLTMDVASLWPAFGAWQNDAGQFEVRIGSQVVLRHRFGRVYKSNPLLRAKLSATFSPSTSGLLPLTISVYRSYAGLFGKTPRVYVDNVVVSLDTRPALKKYGPGCGTLFVPSLNVSSKPYVLSQTVYTGTKNSWGLMLLGTKSLSMVIPGTKSCKVLTDFPVVMPYGLDSSGLWMTNMNLPPRFKGPVNIQHVVFSFGKSWIISTTDAYVIQ